MNRFFALTLASTLAVTALAVPASSQDLVVTSQRTVEALVADASRDLDRQLARSVRGQRFDGAQGLAIVRFECSEDGKPQEMSLVRKSGSRSIDTAALQAVGRLSTLHPLPQSIARGQLFQANVIVADSQYRLEELQRTLARDESARLARREQRNVIALNVKSDGRS